MEVGREMGGEGALKCDGGDGDSDITGSLCIIGDILVV